MGQRGYTMMVGQTTGSASQHLEEKWLKQFELASMDHIYDEWKLEDVHPFKGLTGICRGSLRRIPGSEPADDVSFIEAMIFSGSYSATLCAHFAYDELFRLRALATHALGGPLGDKPPRWKIVPRAVWKHRNAMVSGPG